LNQDTIYFPVVVLLNRLKQETFSETVQFISNLQTVQQIFKLLSASNICSTVATGLWNGRQWGKNSQDGINQVHTRICYVGFQTISCTSERTGV
jgi:hypothetical protein